MYEFPLIPFYLFASNNILWSMVKAAEKANKTKEAAVLLSSFGL